MSGKAILRTRPGQGFVVAVCAALGLILMDAAMARHVEIQPRAERSKAMATEARILAVGLAVPMVLGGASLLAAASSFVSLAHTRRRLRRERVQRIKAEAALRRSEAQSFQTQLKIANEQGRAALRQTEAQMDFALAAGELGGWTRDLVADRFASSELFRVHHGFFPEEPVQGADLLEHIHPGDRDEQIRRVEAAIAEHAVLETEYRTVTPGGATRWLLVRGRADYDEQGQPVRMAGVSMDVTARKAAEERQRLLLDELNHRVKNTLASVQSIALQTGRVAETAQSFEGAFISRLNALARVHDLLTSVAWEGASLAEVVGQTLAPYDSRTGRALRTAFSGPDVRLTPNAAVTLAMAFHELATNAAKYGALSNQVGRIDIDWRTREIGEGLAVEIEWRESGGPAVKPPTRRGFGSQFLQRALAREFDGAVHLRFASSGLDCRMRLPLSTKLRLAA